MELSPESINVIDAFLGLIGTVFGLFGVIFGFSAILSQREIRISLKQNQSNYNIVHLFLGNSVNYSSNTFNNSSPQITILQPEI